MADKKIVAKAATKDFSALGAAELKTELRQAVDARAKLALQHTTAPVKNPMELRRLRRDIARLKTYIRLKETAK